MLRRIHHSVRQHKWIAACACALLLVSAYFLARGWYRSHLVEQELARLRAAGIPTNAQELNEFVAIPPGEPNATAAWMKPITMIDSGAIGRHPYGFDVLDKRGHFPPLPGEDWPEVERAEEYLARHQPLFNAIDQAVATPGRCCFVTDHSDGGNILLPHTQWSRSMIRLLALRAYVRAHRGDTAASLTNIDAMLKSSNILRDEPIEVSQLAYLANLRLAIQTLELLLPHLDAHSSKLREIQTEMGAVNTLHGLQLSTIGNRVLGLIAFEHPSTAGAGSVPAVVYNVWIDDDALSLLTTLSELEKSTAAGWPALRALANRFEGLRWDSRHINAPLGQGAWLSPTKFTEGLAGNVSTFAEMQARLRAAAAGIAAVRYHHATGAWPTSLGSLVPDYLEDLPIDPFTGEPLKLVNNGSKIRIYSVGANRQDDGGVETPEVDEDGDRIYNGTPDVVFRVSTGSVAD